MLRRQQLGLGFLLVLGALAVVLGVLPGRPEAADDVNADPAVARARREVKMLDDLYKTAVVLITKHYVEEESDLPAGSAAKALFAAMKEKGWHEVRLLDAAGKPINDENSPKDDFEKSAVKQLLAGKGYIDEVQQKGGKRVLRAATPIPVVMDKCVLCHPNYKGVKGPIGALGYTLTIE